MRSPFLPADELHPDAKDAPGKDEPAKDDKSVDAKSADSKEAASGGKTPGKASTLVSGARLPKDVKIDFTDLQSRLTEVPTPPGNYDNLQITDKRLCWLDGSDEAPRKLSLKCLEIANKGDEAETIASDIKTFEISLDRKKLLVTKPRSFYIVDSSAGAAAFSDRGAEKDDQRHPPGLSSQIRARTSAASFRCVAVERDYFYDRNACKGWTGMPCVRYLPLMRSRFPTAKS